MFERFTEPARRVIVLAQDEARRLNHGWVGTEHILLGLLRDGKGIAARALTEVGVSLDGARQAVEDMIGRGQEAPSGHVPFTPRSKKVLELSLREALQLGADYIGTEHILLALLREGDGVAAQILAASGADLNRLRQQVIGLLPAGEEAGDRPGAAAAAGAGAGDDLTERLASIAARLDVIERRLRPGQSPAG